MLGHGSALRPRPTCKRFLQHGRTPKAMARNKTGRHRTMADSERPKKVCPKCKGLGQCYLGWRSPLFGVCPACYGVGVVDAERGDVPATDAAEAKRARKAEKLGRIFSKQPHGE